MGADYYESSGERACCRERGGIPGAAKAPPSKGAISIKTFRMRGRNVYDRQQGPHRGS